MAYEPKPGSGAAFVNNKKQSPTHPDYTGRVIGLKGESLFVSVWVKQTKNGDNYLSFMLKEDTSTPQQQPPRREQQQQSTANEVGLAPIQQQNTEPNDVKPSDVTPSDDLPF